MRSKLTIIDAQDCRGAAKLTSIKAMETPSVIHVTSAQERPPEHHRNQHYPWQQVKKQHWSQGSSEALQTQHTQRDAASLINAILWSQEPGKPHVIHMSCTYPGMFKGNDNSHNTAQQCVHALSLPIIAKQLCQSCLPDVQELPIRQHQNAPCLLSKCVDGIQ